MGIRAIKLFNFFALRLHWFSIFLHFPTYLYSWSRFLFSNIWYICNFILLFINLQRNRLLFYILSCFFRLLMVWSFINPWRFSLGFFKNLASHFIFLPCLRIDEVASLFKLGLGHICRRQRLIVINWSWLFAGLIVKVFNFLLQLL